APNVAVLTEPCRLGAKEHFVAERHVDHARDVEVIEIAAGDAQVSFALRVRLSAEHADRAAGAVSAEQRALRAAKHLDTFHVENAHHRPRGPGHEDVVDVEPDAALSGCTSSAAYAANLVIRRRITRASRTLDIEVRGGVRELHHVAYALELQALPRERDDRDRRILKRHLAPLGRDDDFFELRVSRTGGKRTAADETEQDFASERRPP